MREEEDHRSRGRWWREGNDGERPDGEAMEGDLV